MIKQYLVADAGWRSGSEDMTSDSDTSSLGSFHGFDSMDDHRLHGIKHEME